MPPALMPLQERALILRYGSSFRLMLGTRLISSCGTQIAPAFERGTGGEIVAVLYTLTSLRKTRFNYCEATDSSIRAAT